MDFFPCCKFDQNYLSFIHDLVKWVGRWDWEGGNALNSWSSLCANFGLILLILWELNDKYYLRTQTTQEFLITVGS